MSTPARQYHQAMVHYLRCDVTYADDGIVKTIGTVPAGSVILKPISGVHVSTAFNSGTNNFLDIGTTANDDLYGTDLSLATVGLVVLDEAVSYYVSAETTFTATMDLTGTAADAGVAQIVIAYLPPLS